MIIPLSPRWWNGTIDTHAQDVSGLSRACSPSKWFFNPSYGASWNVSDREKCKYEASGWNFGDRSATYVETLMTDVQGRPLGEFWLAMWGSMTANKS